MKIVSITTIKNEADIIESFVRYHQNIFDLMIILDNGSTDDTSYILNELINEGLPIKVILDKDKYFEPAIKYNFLLDKAINEFQADIICPLDADEFLTCDEGNPRRYVEKIPKDTYFTVNRVSYVPTEHDDETDLFVPSRIQYLRDPSLEIQGKIIITRQLVEDYGARLTIGNHYLKMDKLKKHNVSNIEDNDLCIAHFPLRSIKQTMSKVLTNYPNSLARKNVDPNRISYHYTIMYNKIKQRGTLDMEAVTDYATKYDLRHNRGREDFDRDVEIKLFKQPMNIAFCKDIDMKYEYHENPLSNLLENTVYMATEIHKFKSHTPQVKKEKPKKAEEVKVSEEKDNTSKKSFSEKFLSRSNSFTYYKNFHDSYKASMNRKDKEIESLKKKVKSYQSQVKTLKNKANKTSEIIKNQKRELSKLNKSVDINSELRYAFVFNDTIRESQWLKRKDFSLINSAANYSLMYSLYRILNDAQPKNILEMGLGQTSKLTTQYANHFDDVKLTILEGDPVWIDVFSENLNVTDNISISHMELEEFEYYNTKSIRFKDVLDVVGDEKFDLIVIDGPQGFFEDDNGRHLLDYSRTNIWQLIPDNISEEFIIMIDDFNRKGEKRTFKRVKELLNENDIEFYDYTCKGIKHQYAVFSENFRYISWI